MPDVYFFWDCNLLYVCFLIYFARWVQRATITKCSVMWIWTTAMLMCVTDMLTGVGINGWGNQHGAGLWSWLNSVRPGCSLGTCSNWIWRENSVVALGSTFINSKSLVWQQRQLTALVSLWLELLQQGVLPYCSPESASWPLLWDHDVICCVHYLGRIAV